MRSLTEPAPVHHFNWSFPPSECVLSEEEVHVWVADLDQQNVEELLPTLSPDEAKRAARFRFERDRNHFVAGRGVLRKLLSCYLETSAEQLHFVYGKNGKPFLVKAFGVDFNLSHSGGLALYAIARNRALGIDLERIEPCADMDEIAARLFLPEEQSALKFLEAPQKEENFFRYWTRKEAELKCSGEGLSCETQSGYASSILELEPAEGYIATLAVRGRPFSLKSWQFQAAHFAEA